MGSYLQEGGISNQIAKWFPYLLVLIMTVLTVWGVLGLVEYFFPAVVLGLQSPQFPAGLQFIHFFAILATGTIFLVGYFTRWRHTPFATVVMFAVLATLCFVETVDFAAFGEPPQSYVIMGIEYATYLGLSVYLLRSTVMSRRFSSRGETPSAPR